MSKHTAPSNRLRGGRLVARAAQRPGRQATDAIAADLAGYTSSADLLELSAILGRHSDDDATPVRELVDLTRAA